MKQNKCFYVSFFFKVLVSLVAIFSLVFIYQLFIKTAENWYISKVYFFKSRIYSHASALLSRKSDLLSEKYLNWDNEYQDDIELKLINLSLNKEFDIDKGFYLDKEFNEVDMRTCWLSDEQIWMVKELSDDEYLRLKKNCMIEKVNPSNKNWYDG